MFRFKNFGVKDKEERESMAKTAIELVGLEFDKVKTNLLSICPGGEKKASCACGRFGDESQNFSA